MKNHNHSFNSLDNDTKVVRKHYVRDESLVLSKEEAKLANQIAERKGITVTEAATLVLQASIARRMRKRTGKAPARVYSIKRRKS